MGIEIERKFLVDKDKLPSLPIGKKMSQGYIPTQNETTVRVRIQDQDAFLTLKGVAEGISRSEFEYSIPLPEAKSMLSEFCQGGCVEKTRYEIDHDGLVWELDIFSGKNQGLIVAEVELTSEDQAFSKPNWATLEVSAQKKYSNFSLMQTPYSQWD
jgi:adenylate cyclase